jgi:hypothetical protein
MVALDALLVMVTAHLVLMVLLRLVVGPRWLLLVRSLSALL